MAALFDTEAAPFAIDEFLAAERRKDLLRFSTAGSVDDGKSTLIGRLLYDSRNVYEDQVRAVTGARAASGARSIDFAQLTDGLRAEREQGITIDVAYRYFSTERRKFIIADTPGHEQYTRNMATGASTADLAIILIDARKGILTQSRRHAFIASLLGIRHLVAAVNKMDLVAFSEDIYRAIERDFKALVKQLGSAAVVAIPVSALDGDNIVTRSARAGWYSGPTLLEHLEAVPAPGPEPAAPFLLPIQRVIRPDQHFRGFAGQIASGTVRPGDLVVALPSGRSSRIASISTFDGDLDQASAPRSIAVTLEDELDMSRGDVLASANHPPRRAHAIEAALVWFNQEPLHTAQPYLLKHGTQILPARVVRIVHRVNIHTLAEEASATLEMNEIGVAELSTTRPLFFRPYEQNRAAGCFILIDPRSNATLAAGMIRRGVDAQGVDTAGAILLAVAPEQATQAEALLLAAGRSVVRTRVQNIATLNAVTHLGIVVIVEGAGGTLKNALSLEALDRRGILKELCERGVLSQQEGNDVA